MNGIGKALLLSTGIGLIGYGAYKAIKHNQKRELTPTEQKIKHVTDRMFLTNPMFNPLGAGYHLVNPDADTNAFDSPLVRFIVDKNVPKQGFEKVPSNLTREERMKYFQDRGGTGLRMDAAA